MNTNSDKKSRANKANQASEVKPAGERRRNLRLRALFDEACERVAECYRQPASLLPTEWLVYRKARESYPQLAPLELFQLTMAAGRKRQIAGSGRTHR